MSSPLACDGPREGWCDTVGQFVDRLLAAAARSDRGLHAEDIGHEFERFAMDAARGSDAPASDACRREPPRPVENLGGPCEQVFVQQVERLFAEMAEVERLSRRVALGFVLAAGRGPGEDLSGDAASHEYPVDLPDPVPHKGRLVNLALLGVARDFRNDFETCLQTFVETVNGGLSSHAAGAHWSMDTSKALTMLDAVFRDLRAQLRDGGEAGLDARYGRGCGKVLEDFLDMLDENLETAAERHPLLTTMIAGGPAVER